MNQKQILSALLVIAILSLVVAYYMQKNLQVSGVTPTTNTSATPDTVQKEPPVTLKYMIENIMTLSPIKPAEGKSFRVTKLQLSAATGTVEYGDGNNSYVGNFNYSVDASGNMKVSGFTIKK